MKKSLTNKTALVCGGSDGLGYGAAYELASAGAKRGALAVRNASPSTKVEKESFLDAIAELEGENTRLHQALEEVEEALDVEAKRLDLADGGALLESLRTRRLLETAELALKVRKGP